jgi:xanthine/uracil permease
LLRQEVQLGLAHVDKRADELKASLIAATMSGALLYAGLLAVVASVILLIAKFIDPWLAALIVGVVVSGVGYAIMPREVLKHDDSDASSSAALKNKTTFKETRT